MVRLPVRIDFLGSWSDQECWQGPAAVLNAAVGWDGGYPLTLDDDGRLHSEVPGIGTGLGISSILAAGRFLKANPDGDYVRAVLDWERAVGTCGGWQDQLGGVAGGFKLISTDNHREFTVLRNDQHPLFQHLVLFDTGIRRPSGRLGDRVRALLADPASAFVRVLRGTVDDARIAFAETEDAGYGIGLCLEAWERLCALVPEMRVPVPNPPHTLGHKLCGAGGGGFGLYFVDDPEARAAVVSYLRERGYWAVVPELRDGMRLE